MSDPSTFPNGAPPRSRPNGPNRRRPRLRFSRGSRSGHDGAGKDIRRLGTGPRLRAALVAALVVALAIGTPVFLSSGGVRGAPAGAPTLQGYYIVGNGAALVAVGYVGWANIWTAAGNGSQVFSSAFYLAFFNLRTTNVTIPLDVNENGVWVFNGSVTITRLSQADVTIPLPATTSWTPTTIYFYKIPTWSGWAATPISLLPNYILNVGGLDLLGLAIVSFSLIFVTIGVTVARVVMRRAIWAPKFTALIWFHVVLACIGGFVFIDFQLVDSTFAGWSPLVYPAFLLPMAFLWALSLFNRGQRVQIQQGILTGNDEMGYLLTDVRIGRLPDGRVVPVGEGIPHFWARVFGHHAAPFDNGDPSKARPWFAPVVRGISPTGSTRERLKAKKTAAHVATATDALTKFPVLNSTERDDIAYIALGKGTTSPVVNYPYLSVHRLVVIHHDAERLGDGTVVKPAWDETKRKLSLPHYVDPDSSDTPELEDYHYETAAAVWAKFAAIRDLGRVYSKIAHAFAMLSASIEGRVNDEVSAQLRTHYSLIYRVSSGISEEEAARRSGQLADLLETKKGGAP